MSGTGADPTTATEHYDLLAPQQIELVRAVLPALEPQWVRVRIAYCGVCGSDRSYYDGGRTRDLPVSLGHEWVGTVETTGAGVESFAPGDVVTTDLNFRCETCRQCSNGRSHLCEQGQIGQFSNRGFASRTDIHASYLRKCAARSPAPQLALAEPLSCALHALSHSRLSSSDRVLLIGTGGVGLCMAFGLANESSVAFDVTDLQPERLSRIGPVIGPRGRTVSTPTAQYDVVLDASGTVEGLRAACERVDSGGRLCTMSHPPNSTKADFLLDLLLRKDVTINFSYLNGESENLTRSIALIEQRWTPAWSALLDLRPLDALINVFRDGPAPSSIKVVIDLGGR